MKMLRPDSKWRIVLWTASDYFYLNCAVAA